MDTTLGQPMMYKFTCPENKDNCPNNKDWKLKSCEVLPVDKQTPGAEILAKENMVTDIHLDGNSFMLPIGGYMWTGDCYFGEASATGIVTTPTFEECKGLLPETNIMTRPKGWKFPSAETPYRHETTMSGGGRRLNDVAEAVAAEAVTDMIDYLTGLKLRTTRSPSKAKALWDAAMDSYEPGTCIDERCKVLQTCQKDTSYGKLEEKTNVLHYSASGNIRNATTAGEVTAGNSVAQFQLKCKNVLGNAPQSGHDCNIVLAFAGSDDITDWLQNTQAWPSEVSTRTGKEYHSGFKEYTDSLFGCVEFYREELQQKKHTLDYIVGHSLGGAAATIYAQESALGNARHGVVTFGAPKTNVSPAAVKGYRYD